MSTWKVYFNRGTTDWSQAWVIENTEPGGTQVVAAKLKLNGATAESHIAPEGTPKGYFIVSGNLKFENQVAEFSQ